MDDVPPSLIEPIINSSFFFILNVVNQSLRNGIFPENLKTSHITPIYKKGSFDKNVLAHFRPINDIPYMSKIIEKCALLQLQEHLNSANLLIPNQSAYKSNHSCETVLIKVQEDVHTDLNNNNSVILGLLDFSSAFDTINHNLLLSKLQNHYGIHGTALKWFSSYFENRSYHVKIEDSLSNGTSMICGVPQGSILGPVIFNLYLQPISSIINSYELNYHIFADDIQIYTPYSGLQYQLSKFKSCILDIATWSQKNYLKLNNKKTKFLNIRLKNNNSVINTFEIFNETFTLEPNVKSLGFVIDHNLSCKQQIKKVCNYGYFILSNLWRISAKLKSISIKTQLVHSCIFSHIDYCNTLYFNLPKRDTQRLQVLMNSAVRFIHNIRNIRTHITPFFKKSHILPVSLRIKFKIALLIFKCHNNIAPLYLQSCISKKISLQSLRVYHDTTLLHEPTLEKLSQKNRKFSVFGPKIWNELPRSLRELSSLSQFKSRLKAYLFTQF